MIEQYTNILNFQVSTLYELLYTKQFNMCKAGTVDLTASHVQYSHFLLSLKHKTSDHACIPGIPQKVVQVYACTSSTPN